MRTRTLYNKQNRTRLIVRYRTLKIYIIIIGRELKYIFYNARTFEAHLHDYYNNTYRRIL